MFGMKLRKGAACLAVALLLGMCAQVRGDSISDNLSISSVPVSATGQFTAHDGKIYYWGGGGFNIYDTDTGTNTVIGLPTGGTNSNGYGDCFGIMDTVNNTFYAATYVSASKCEVYAYDMNSGTWSTEGPDGTSVTNAYGGATDGNGLLYISGLTETWSGGYGQPTSVYVLDVDSGTTDVLVGAEGNSACVALDDAGGIYYATYTAGTSSSPALYYWAADQVATAFDTLYDSTATDEYLGLSDATLLCSLPGGANGVAVDDGGNIFFTVNNANIDGEYCSLLCMVDDTAEDGYIIVYTSTSPYAWWGPIDVDGDFLNGGTLYFSPWSTLTTITYTGSSSGAQAVPEPSALLFLGLGGILLVRRRRSSGKAAA